MKVRATTKRIGKVLRAAKTKLKRLTSRGERPRRLARLSSRIRRLTENYVNRLRVESIKPVVVDETTS